MPNRPQGIAALEAAYYRKLYKEDEPGTERLSLAFPGKDVTGKIKDNDVKPVPKRQSNQRIRSELGKPE
jgi:hypothetical protein